MREGECEEKQNPVKILNEINPKVRRKPKRKKQQHCVMFNGIAIAIHNDISYPTHQWKRFYLLPYPLFQASSMSLIMSLVLCLQAVAQLKEKGDSPYPHKFKVDISLEDFIAKFNNIKAGEHLTDQIISVAGEICEIDAF